MESDPEGTRVDQEVGMLEDRYDVWGTFARTHLSTPAERSVYLSLVGAPLDTQPSAEDIASERDLVLDEVADILMRFESASIAEEVGRVGGPRRYRWRDDMRYLEAGSVDAFDLLDPVCLMPVRTDTPYRAGDTEGGEHVFCSSLCLAAFRAIPATFASSATRRGPGGSPGPRAGRGDPAAPPLVRGR